MKTVTLALSFSLLTRLASAQTAAEWTFSNNLNGNPGAHLTAGNAALGTSILSQAFNGTGEFYGQNGWPTGSPDANAYLEFTVTGNAGYYLVLNSVSVNIRRSNTGSPAGAGPNSFSLRSSLDGYTTDIYTNTMTYNYATYTMPLPAAFQSIPSTVTFRLYGYNTTVNSGGSSRFVYHDITVLGTALPGTLAEQSLALNAGVAGGAIDLQWQGTGLPEATEYTLQRSADGSDFTAIDRQSGSGPFHYTDDAAPSAPKLFYRVAALQPDGSTLYSSIVAVSPAATALPLIRAIAAEGNSVRVLFHLPAAGAFQATIWSSDGRPLLRQTMQGQAGDGTDALLLGARPHGIYVLTLAGNGVSASRSFFY